MAIRFLVEGPSMVADLVRQHGFSVTLLAEGIGVKAESRIQESLPRPSVTIVEMLNCSYQRQTMLRQRTGKLVVFDDLFDHRFAADLVIGGQELPNYGNKSISDSHTTFVHGYEYFVFDKACRQYSWQDREYSDAINRVLVILGGGQYDEAYLKVARAIENLKYKCNVRFILGPAENTLLEKEIYAHLPDCEIYGFDPDIYGQFWETDLAIVSAGYLKIEAVLTRTPALMIATQWHQIPLAEVFHQKSRMPYVGYKAFCTEEDIASALSALMPLPARLKLLREYPFFDGLGLDRVFEAIFQE